MTLTALILVTLLGDSSFIVRERAMGRLFKLVDYAPHVLLVAERSPIPEIAQRAQIVVSKWIKDNAGELVWRELPDNWEEFPWIGRNDEYEDHEFQDIWLGAVDKAASNKAPTWDRWRRAARLYLVELVASRQPVRKIIQELCFMEIRWCLANGYEAPPAPVWKKE